MALDAKTVDIPKDLKKNNLKAILQKSPLFPYYEPETKNPENEDIFKANLRKSPTGVPLREHLLLKVFEISPLPMAVSRLADGAFLFVNDQFVSMTGYSQEEVIGKVIGELELIPIDQQRPLCDHLRRHGEISNKELQYWTRNRELREGVFAAEIITVGDDRLIVSVLNDVTEQRRLEKELAMRESELEKRNEDLAEAGTALRVIMNRRNEEQELLGKKLQSNVNEMVMPLIAKLKHCVADNKGKQTIKLLEKYIGDITKSFIKIFSETHRNMTRKEIQVAVLIREGKTSKEIANLLGVSQGTVNTHRHNIRRKLLLKQKNNRLSAYLLSMD